MEVKTIKKVNLLSDRQTGKRHVKPAGEMIPKIGTTYRQKGWEKFRGWYIF